MAVMFSRSLLMSILEWTNRAPLNSCQIDQLQKVSNAAARVTQQVPRYSHLTQVLMSLHWLPIALRIKFKALKGMAPLYLSKMLLRKESEEDKVKLWDMCSASGANKELIHHEERVSDKQTYVRDFRFLP